MTDPTRVASDFLGDVRIPAAAPWGSGTARALANSGIGFPTLGDVSALLEALLVVKQAAARANGDLGIVDRRIAEAIDAAARGLRTQPAPGDFPLEIVQGGGGTALNMNVNEVLATRASDALGGAGIIVHPNDHVNRCQSTNDVFPTAASVALVGVLDSALPTLDRVAQALDALAERYDGHERLGRSCLMDAVPLPIAAGHRAQAAAVRRAAAGLEAARGPLLGVPLGGTAVGTGLGAVPGFAERAVAQLARLTGSPFTPSADRFEAIASLEVVAHVATAAAAASRALARVAGDLRLLAAGPVGGAGEVELPAVQAGSSIMPGKVNPVIPELVLQASFRISGAAHTVALAAASAELDVTPMGPVAVAETLLATRMLGAVADLFADRCLARLEWRLDRVAGNLAGSFHAEVEFAAEHGYDAAARRRAGVTGGMTR